MSEKEINIDLAMPGMDKTIQTIKGAEFFNEMPEGEIVIKIWNNNGKLWVETESGKKYIVPHYSEGKAIRADLRLIKDE